jgi:Purine catabolism regulatory protein-like family.
LIVDVKDWNLPVTGINILEATDIEKWGKPGMAILTSYFALQSHSDEELLVFCDKIKQLGISCIIIKVDRLISEIPEQFVNLCNTFEIPLIRISGATKYEDIIVEVLTFILGIREQRLALYYKVSKIGSEMALEMLSLREILLRFRAFLGLEMTLMKRGKRASISTNKQLLNLQLS